MANDDLGAGAVEWLGTQYKTILSTEQSTGGISITDSISPASSGPPRHIHHDADETFVVLTGEIGFWLDGETHIRRAGETIFIPKGAPHTFVVLSDVPSRHLIIMTPGGFEGFFAEMAAGQFAIPGDMPQVEESAGRFQLSFCGPPLSAADFGR